VAVFNYGELDNNTKLAYFQPSPKVRKVYGNRVLNEPSGPKREVTGR